MPKSKSQVAVLPPPSRVLFARIGWMTYYAGPQSGDEQPKGGGAYNRKNLGHEVFNLAEFGGRLYGFARAKSGRINLARIEPSAAEPERLEDVLIVFVASQRVIGWYRNAIVYAHRNPKFPASVKTEMKHRLKPAATKKFTFWGYCFEASVEDRHCCRFTRGTIESGRFPRVLREDSANITFDTPIGRTA